MHINLEKQTYDDVLNILSQTDIFSENKLDITFSFLPDFHRCHEIRSIVSQILSTYQISRVWVSRGKLIADELVSNAIEHSRRSEHPITFRVHITLEGDGIIMVFEVLNDITHSEINSEKLTSIFLQKSKTWETQIERQRGRGFQIMVRLADDLYFENVGENQLLVGLKRKILFEQ